MKKLLLLLFSVLISFSSYGDWEEVAENTKGDTYYMDFDKIKEHQGYVYFWFLIENVKPREWTDIYGDIPWLFKSESSYLQVDCGINRYKELSSTGYTKSMGSGEINQVNNPAPDWNYFPPNTVGEAMLELACDL